MSLTQAQIAHLAERLQVMHRIEAEAANLPAVPTWDAMTDDERTAATAAVERIADGTDGDARAVFVSWDAVLRGAGWDQSSDFKASRKAKRHPLVGMDWFDMSAAQQRTFRQQFEIVRAVVELP